MRLTLAHRVVCRPRRDCVALVVGAGRPRPSLILPEFGSLAQHAPPSAAPRTHRHRVMETLLVQRFPLTPPSACGAAKRFKGRALAPLPSPEVRPLLLRRDFHVGLLVAAMDLVAAVAVQVRPAERQQCCPTCRCRGGLGIARGGRGCGFGHGRRRWTPPWHYLRRMEAASCPGPCQPPSRSTVASQCGRASGAAGSRPDAAGTSRWLLALARCYPPTRPPLAHPLRTSNHRCIEQCFGLSSSHPLPPELTAYLTSARRTLLERHLLADNSTLYEIAHQSGAAGPAVQRHRHRAVLRARFADLC